MTRFRPYLVLAGIVLLGALLRFWHLAFKPLWLDEVITALFSLGRSYYDVPLNGIFPVSALDAVFTLKPETSCAQIAETVSTQSVHPPLFFCWMHSWLTWVAPLPQSWIWKLRALPALIGVAAIAAIYLLNRVAFSAIAGLMAAGVMAVSPFAVYLSQEARHYTLPILLVILALLGLYHLITDLKQQRYRPAIWLGWMAVNSLGFYVHYFFLLAFVGQAVTLVVAGIGERERPQGDRALDDPDILQSRAATRDRRQAWMVIGLAIAGVCLTYLPWLPTFLSHMSRPETDWLQPSQTGWISAIAPLYRLVVGWVLMVIALPVENQPAWLAIAAAVVMVLVAGWVVWQISGAIRRLWQAPDQQDATRMLLTYTLVVLLQFLVIVYGLGKDITLVPRYNFIYFPAVCALLGAGLSQSRGNRRLVWVVVLVGVLSSVLTVSDLVFQKPYYPDQVATRMRVDTDVPIVVGAAYADLQDVAMELSFALALRRQELNASPAVPASQFAFLPRSPGYDSVWATLARLDRLPQAPLNLWIIAPGLKRVGYPAQLTLAATSGKPMRCTIDPAHYYRIGIPYQLYRCGR